MRIMGLDVGERKIGISLSDPTFSIALAHKVYRRSSMKEDLEEFKKIVENYDIKEIVIGLPKNLNGTIGKKAKEIMNFSEEIEKYTLIPIVLWDERFSTNEAHRILEMAQIKHKKRRPLLDMMASQIILQGYLDAHKKR
jgi:putative Holliday junction resolvase